MQSTPPPATTPQPQAAAARSTGLLKSSRVTAGSTLLSRLWGVVWETVKRDTVTQEEIGGYNDVMRVEIEHRFGRGIIEKLHKKAEEKK